MVEDRDINKFTSNGNWTQVKTLRESSKQLVSRRKICPYIYRYIPYIYRYIPCIYRYIPYIYRYIPCIYRYIPYIYIDIYPIYIDIYPIYIDIHPIYIDIIDINCNNNTKDFLIYLFFSFLQLLIWRLQLPIWDVASYIYRCYINIMRILND